MQGCRLKLEKRHNVVARKKKELIAPTNFSLARRIFLADARIAKIVPLQFYPGRSTELFSLCQLGVFAKAT